MTSFSFFPSLSIMVNYSHILSVASTSLCPCTASSLSTCACENPHCNYPALPVPTLELHKLTTLKTTQSCKLLTRCSVITDYGWPFQDNPSHTLFPWSAYFPILLDNHYICSPSFLKPLFTSWLISLWKQNQSEENVEQLPPPGPPTNPPASKVCFVFYCDGWNLYA